jgi:hypothetical protein
MSLLYERIEFPTGESKGKRTKRIIYLHGSALAWIPTEGITD